MSCVTIYQRGDVGVSVRGRREAVNLWRPLQQYPNTRDKMTAFWKRAYPHDNTLNSFWKRRLPAGAGAQAFWKRFVETANDDDLATMFAEYNTRRQAADKKNFNIAGLKQQRRAKESSARRPEFNPTGW